MTKKSQKIKYHCDNHPDRVAAVERNGRLLCWQCYLPPEQFATRFGPNFYRSGTY